MNPHKILTLTTAALVTACNFGYAAALVTVNIDTGSKSLQDSLGVPLSGGNPNINGDGAPVQLGYYQGATAGNPFGSGTDATFISLVGAGGQHNVPLTIGDTEADGAGNGEIFASGLNIFTGVNDSRLPVVGTPLVLRIANVNNSERLVLANTTLWLWRSPADAPSQPLININLSDLGLIGRTGVNSENTASVSGNNLRTTLVPEPTSAFLTILGLVSIVSRRRRDNVS